jgi:hypothetical protein
MPNLTVIIAGGDAPVRTRTAQRTPTTARWGPERVAARKDAGFLFK